MSVGSPQLRDFRVLAQLDVISVRRDLSVAGVRTDTLSVASPIVDREPGGTMTTEESMMNDDVQLPLWTNEGELDAGTSEKAVRETVARGRNVGPVERECLWDIKAVSQFLGVPVATIYQWRVKGEGPRATKMGKHLRFEPAVVRAWVSEHRETA